MLDRTTKPQAHLIDTVESLFGNHRYKRTAEFVHSMRHQARRFIFDEHASLHVGHFIRDCGDLILLNRQFAIPPFETTYLELEIRKVHEGVGKGTSDRIWGPQTSDTKIAFLTHRDAVYVMAASEKTPNGTLATWSYHLNGQYSCGPIFPDEPLNLDDPFDHWLRAALLLGTTIHDLPDEETRSAIIHNTRIVCNFDEPLTKPHRWNLLISAFGEIRTLWAALLLLNQQHNVETVHVPWKSGILRGKRHVYAAHRMVKIDLHEKPIRRVFGPSMVHTPRRRHEVKGHFMHWDCVAHCVHQWPMMPEIEPGHDRPRWQCMKCGGWRTWRKDHIRGHGAVGFVTKDYRVTDTGG